MIHPYVRRFTALLFTSTPLFAQQGMLSDSSREAFARMVFSYTRPDAAPSATAVSPDGRWIAFSAAAQLGEAFANDFRQLVTAHNTLYVGSLTDPRASRVRVGPPNTASWDPVWSGDGQYLAFNTLVDGVIRI